MKHQRTRWDNIGVIPCAFYRQSVEGRGGVLAIMQLRINVAPPLIRYSVKLRTLEWKCVRVFLSELSRLSVSLAVTSQSYVLPGKTLKASQPALCRLRQNTCHGKLNNGRTSASFSGAPAPKNLKITLRER